MLLPTVLSLLDALVLPVLILMQPTAFVDRVSAPILLDVHAFLAE